MLLAACSREAGCELPGLEPGGQIDLVIPLIVILRSPLLQSQLASGPILQVPQGMLGPPPSKCKSCTHASRQNHACPAGPHSAMPLLSGCQAAQVEGYAAEVRSHRCHLHHCPGVYVFLLWPLMGCPSEIIGKESPVHNSLLPRLRAEMGPQLVL